MPNYSKSDVALVIIAVCLIASVIYAVNLSSYNCDSIPPNHYWSGQNAPDGEYEVFWSYVDIEQRIDYESHIVTFPLCPTSPCRLHGDWHFADGVVFPSKADDIVVVLENNVIIEVKLDA